VGDNGKYEISDNLANDVDIDVFLAIKKGADVHCAVKIVEKWR
jgi:hypothetical protein